MRYLLIALLIATVAEGSRVGVYRGWEAAQLRRAGVLTWEEAGLNEGLVSYWAMRTDGDTVIDEFGDNDGTAINNPTFSAANGVRDDGVGLNGTSQYLIKNVSNFRGSDTNGTFVAWMKPNGARHLFAKATTGSAGEFVDLFITTSLIAVSAFKPSTFSDVVRADVSLTNGVWYHIAVTAAGTSAAGGYKIYLNGNQLTTYVNPGEGANNGRWLNQFSGANNFTIGARVRNTISYWTGTIDEVAIWNRALSSNEVYKIYNTPLYAPYRED
jgi:hypothetical protein